MFGGSYCLSCSPLTAAAVMSQGAKEAEIRQWGFELPSASAVLIALNSGLPGGKSSFVNVGTLRKGVWVVDFAYVALQYFNFLVYDSVYI